jgi:hypothetical protein
MNASLREYIAAPYFSRFETTGVSMAVGVVTLAPSLFGAALALAVLIVMALIVAATKTLWGSK